MKSCFRLKLILIILLGCVSLSLTGCTLVSGSYVGASSASTAALHGKLLGAKLVPINSNLVYSGDPAISRNSDIYQYRIGPSDVLNIVVWNHPELNEPTADQSLANFASLTGAQRAPFTSPAQQAGIVVDGDGYIFFPFAGRFKVDGLTVDETRQEITNKLTEYIRKPQVSVRVGVFNSKTINIMGEVNGPGVRPLTDKPINILDALNYAGGISPGSADAHHIYVFRGDLNNVRVYWLDATSPPALLMAQHFRLVANDIVYVPPVWLTSWNRIVSQILPTIETVWYTHDLTQHN